MVFHPGGGSSPVRAADRDHPKGAEFPTLIALGFAVYVIFLNFRGASSAAKLQAFLTKALLCGMLLAMGVSLFTGSPDNAMPVFSQVTGAGGGKAATESTSLFAGIVSVDSAPLGRDYYKRWELACLPS